MQTHTVYVLQKIGIVSSAQAVASLFHHLYDIISLKKQFYCFCNIVENLQFLLKKRGIVKKPAFSGN